MLNHNKQISPNAYVQKKIRTPISESYNDKLEKFNFWIHKAWKKVYYYYYIIYPFQL